jgi:hypothetical protein
MSAPRISTITAPFALNDLQVAQDTEDKAKVAVDTAASTSGCSATIPTKNFMVDIFAPVSGVITDQQVTTVGLSCRRTARRTRSRSPISRQRLG